jgi:thymidylate synthase (FAD)
MNTLICPVTGDTMVDALAVAIHKDLINQKCLDHGFVKVLDCMPRLIPVDVRGCDFALADAARISYQKGTRKANSDTALIDHLIRNEHTSPIEMGELKFHIRLPIFVMRQHVRHRTASLNEESARYSELASDFYIPEPQNWAMNTAANKQATVKYDMPQEVAHKLHQWIKDHNEDSYRLYQQLLDGSESADADIVVPGIAREQARMVLGVNIYTQCVWKCDLKNLLHYLRLRTDKHAQWEIRVFADAIARVVAALFPASWNSFEDNFIKGVRFSGVELTVVRRMGDITITEFSDLLKNLGWSKSRWIEFKKKLIRSGLGNVSEERLDHLEALAFPPAPAKV